MGRAHWRSIPAGRGRLAHAAMLTRTDDLVPSGGDLAGALLGDALGHTTILSDVDHGAIGRHGEWGSNWGRFFTGLLAEIESGTCTTPSVEKRDRTESRKGLYETCGNEKVPHQEALHASMGWLTQSLWVGVPGASGGGPAFSELQWVKSVQ